MIFPLPLDDFAPEIPPVPLRGTEATPHDALLAWRKEFDAATLACAATAAEQKVADAAEATAEEALNAAITARNVAADRESNTKACSSMAYKRLSTARTKYQELLAIVHPDPPSSPSPLASRSRTPLQGDARASTSDAEDEASDFDGDVFDGFEVDLGGDVDELEVEEADLV